MTQGWDSGNQDPNAGYPNPSYPPAESPGYPKPDYPQQGYPQTAAYPEQTGFPQQEYPQAGYAQPGYAQPGYAQPGYAQPGFGQPGYPQQGYPQPGYPQSGYPQPGYGQPGYPQPGYAVLVPAKPPKPGSVKGAAVLAFIQAGLVIIGGLYTFGGGAVLSDIDFNDSLGIGTQVIILGVLSLISGGLLIAGGVSAFNRKFTLLFAGAGLSLALSVWWIILITAYDIPVLTSGLLVMAIVFAIMPIISLALLFGSTAQRWSKTPDVAY